MLFMIQGILKAGSEEQLLALHNEFNEHLSQPFRTLAAAGVLRDPEGKRRGYLGFLEADNFADAERWLHESPFYQEGLYERVDVFEFNVEVGTIG
jgi:uncharacterized protein YciI